MALAIPRQRFCSHGRSARMPVTPAVMVTAARDGDEWTLTCSACPDMSVGLQSRVDAIGFAVSHRHDSHQAEALFGFSIDQ